MVVESEAARRRSLRFSTVGAAIARAAQARRMMDENCMMAVDLRWEPEEAGEVDAEVSD